MPYYQFRHILPYISGLPGDVVVNTWTVFDPGPGDIEEVFIAFERFYTAGLTEGGTNLGQSISSVVSRATDVCTVEAATVDLTTKVMSPPIGIAPFTMPEADTDSSLPLEVALCTSFRAPGTGVPIGQRSGRVYIGPWISSAVDVTVDNYARPAPAAVQLLADVTERLVAEIAAAGCALQVWSRPDPPRGRNIGTGYPVTSGWVDNEWDTMRSRQVESTARVVW